MNDDIKIYLPFNKKDNDERIVEGYATSEDLDSQGEVVKIEAVKKALPDYMKFANIREMHQPSAVGKAVKVKIDEAKKALYLVAKVVDDVAWKKCKEGVYNGFSIGGRALKTVGNQIEDLILTEISLVDRPANPSAIFSLVKMDKSTAEIQEEVEEFKFGEVFRAERALELTAALVYMYDSYKARGVDTGEIEKAIEILKNMVKQELENALATEKMDDAKVLKGVMGTLEKRTMEHSQLETTNYFENLKKFI